MTTPEPDAAAVSVSEALRLADDGAWLLDVREQDEWDAGHLAAAHLLPMSVIGARLGEVPTDRRILVICHSGARSDRVSSALREAGFDAVNVTGGMMAARAGGLAIVTAADGAPRADA